MVRTSTEFNIKLCLFAMRNGAGEVEEDGGSGRRLDMA